MRRVGILVVAAAALFSGLEARAVEPFEIRVIDAETKRGVPLVELTTTNRITHVTDSAGLIAFNEPGLMDSRVHFEIRSHGYEYPKDGFGYAGKTLDVSSGGQATIEIQRVNIAERLYRVTGQGIYRDTVLLGVEPPLAEPVLNGRVMGQDSVQVVPYRGKLYWFWGDTGKPDYPLGNFEVSGATSLLPSRGGLDPEKGIDLRYFTDEHGFSRSMCPIEGPGPVWIDGLVTLEDDDGKECLLARFSRIKSLGEVHEHGLAMYDDDAELFKPVVRWELDVPLHPQGQAQLLMIGADRYVVFANPFPTVRVRANLADMKAPSAYEAYTCLESNSGATAKRAGVERGASGAAVYGWKRDALPMDHGRQFDLIEAGTLKPEDAWLHLRDIETGDPVRTHGGSLSFNPWRQRWIIIALQFGGSASLLGEVWFAEADTPLGPWVYARRIVTHDKYSFYNVRHHPFFDADRGRRIFFEGTYTAMFSGNPEETPRYDYNQIMYGLSLDDPRLSLPLPVYAVRDLAGGVGYMMGAELTARDAWDRVEEIAFFAIPAEREGEALVTVWSEPQVSDSGDRRLRVASDADVRAQEFAVFKALPPGSQPQYASTVALYEYELPDGGGRRYATKDRSPAEGATRSTEPLCYVWSSPVNTLPVTAGEDARWTPLSFTDSE